MKTKKQIAEQRARIEQHQRDGVGELPDIGYDYRHILSDAQRDNLAWQLEDEKWLASSKPYRPRPVKKAK